MLKVLVGPHYTEPPDRGQGSLYDSYEDEPTASLAGLGGVLRLELLLEPREWRGEPALCSPCPWWLVS